jgi:hypothetical protein
LSRFFARFQGTSLPKIVSKELTMFASTIWTASSQAAYQPQLLEPNLTAKEADRRIAIQKAEIELANSF